MTTLKKTVLTLAFGLLATGLAQAQRPVEAMAAAGPTATRAQVKMDREEFLRTHRWDDTSDVWTLQDNFDPPMGVRSRADVRAARDTFLRANRWDELNGMWKPRTPVVREPSDKSRAEVRAETIQFTKTHRYDEATEVWVERTPLRAKP
jgi:hypothetical protein